MKAVSPQSSRWTRTVRICGLCLLEGKHRECQEVTLRIPWWAERVLRRAYLEARR